MVCLMKTRSSTGQIRVMQIPIMMDTRIAKRSIAHGIPSLANSLHDNHSMIRAHILPIRGSDEVLMSRLILFPRIQSSGEDSDLHRFSQISDSISMIMVTGKSFISFSFLSRFSDLSTHLDLVTRSESSSHRSSIKTSRSRNEFSTLSYFLSFISSI